MDATDNRSPLRHFSIPRARLKDRPLRSLTELRAERNDIDKALLDLVADDPAAVEEVNRLLDAITVNGLDHSRRTAAPLHEEIATLRERVAELEKVHLATKTPDVALAKALGRIRHLLLSSINSTPPTAKTTDRAISDVFLAVDRLVDAAREQAAFAAEDARVCGEEATGG